LLLSEARFLSYNCLCDWKGKKRGVGSAHLLPIPFFFPNSRKSLLYFLAHNSLWSACVLIKKLPQQLQSTNFENKAKKLHDRNLKVQIFRLGTHLSRTTNAFLFYVETKCSGERIMKPKVKKPTEKERQEAET
jgi:hypothetical protein